MTSWSLTARIALAIFCLLVLPSAGCAAPTQQLSGTHPEFILSDPTPLYVWNVPLNAVLLGLLSIAVPTALLILIQSLFALSTWLQFGHKRVLCRNILDNENRNAVYTCIRENPGIRMRPLSRVVGMNIGTVRYHVNLLCRMGKVVSEQDGRGITYYINSDFFPDLEKKVTGYLYESPKGRIINLILQHPGCTRKDIASGLIMSGPNVTRHTRSLIREGIIRSNKSGRYVRYYLSPDLEEHVNTRKSWKSLSGDGRISST